MMIIAGVADYLEGRSDAVARNLIRERITLSFAAGAAFYPPAPDWVQANRKAGNSDFIFEYSIKTGNTRSTGYGD